MDLVYKKSENRNNTLFLVFVIIVIAFVLARVDSTFNYHTEELTSNVAINIGNGLIRQDIPADISDLSSIEILFGTYQRVNEGIVVVTLYEDESIINQWQYDSSCIQDNRYSRFDLDCVYHLSEKHSYYFTIENRCEGNDSIAVWAYEKGGIVNNICYRLVCSNLSIKYIFSGVAILLLAVTSLMIVLHIDERIIMCFVMAALVIVFSLIFPLGTIPDESQHFYRAYEIAHGSLISRSVANKAGCNYLPCALTSFNDNNAIIDWSETKAFTFPNASLYAPVSYIPQVIGIIVAELLTGQVFWIFVGGRVAGTIICVVLLAASIWIIPYGRKILFAIILFPLTLQETISMAPDGFTISLSIFFFSFILYLNNKKSKLRKQEYTVLTFMCLLLSLCKVVYVVLVILVLLIPEEKFKQRRDRVVFVAGVLLLSGVLNLIWLNLASSFLIEFQPGVDAVAQVKSIICNPFNYYLTVERTLIDNLEFYIKSMIGSNMGALNISVSSSVWISHLVLFVSMIVGNNERITMTRKQDKLILFSVFAVCSALILTSLYVQWTALGNEIVLGVQGRYFIPIIALLAFGILYSIHERKSRALSIRYCESRGSYYYILLLLFNGIAVLDIIRYYNCLVL